jgi:hypothetical protein
MVWALVIAAIAAGASLIGGALKTKALSDESKAEEAAARDEAAQTRLETDWKIGDLQTQQKQFLGNQQAMIGRSGVKLSSGSPLAFMSETSSRMTEDVRRMRQQGEWDAEAMEAEADVYKKTRPYQVWGSLFGSLATAGSMLASAL